MPKQKKSDTPKPSGTKQMKTTDIKEVEKLQAQGYAVVDIHDEGNFTKTYTLEKP